MEAVRKLTNVQIELLKLFQYDLPENQLAELKKLLSSYFAQTATKEMDKLWDENNWSNDIMKEWAGDDLKKNSDENCIGHQCAIGFNPFQVIISPYF